MKNIIKYPLGFIILLTVVTTSCKKEFQKLNTNPNTLEVPNDPSLVGNIEVNTFFNSAYNAWTLGNGMSQYAAFSQSYYNTLARYIPASNQPYWQVLYSNARDANQVIADSKTNGNTAMQAVGLILRAYSFAQLTDLWGDIPFKSALQGQNSIFAAAYDSQQTVYTDATLGVIPSLRSADSLLKISNSAITGDLLYSGDKTKWRKFCNGLRLRYLLRASSKLNAASEMQQIVTDGVIFKNTSESAELTLPSSVPYAFPSLTERSGDYSIKYLNSLLYNFFVSTGDQQRLSLLFAKNVTNQSATGFNFNYYGGMPVVADANTAQVASSSGFNSSIFLNNPASVVLKARVITYQEVQFILAEASLKGLIATAVPTATYYTNGITGAYVDYGLDATTYLTNPSVIYDPTNALSQIITQKWVGNFNVDFQGWIEYRRTGIPVLDATSANLNSGKISSRFVYPTDERTINANNYNAQIQLQGGTESTIYKAWWEK